MREMFECRVHVYEPGYKWIETTEQEEPGERATWYLTTGQHVSPYTAPKGYLSYNPLALSGLFRDFAEVEPTKDAILDFANAYGALNSNTRHIALKTDRGRLKFSGEGEPLNDWIFQIAFMKRTIELWDMVRRRDTDGLAHHIRWERTERGMEAVYDHYPDVVPSNYLTPPVSPEVIVIASDLVNPQILETCQPGDLILPALHVVMGAVNTHLFQESSIRLRWDAPHANLRLTTQTVGLHNALWLQFALAIDGGRDYRKCKGCGKWFELHPDIHRSNSLFCGNACRQKGYRQRQAEAQRMQADGMGVEEIAQVLQTDAKTVQGWVSQTSATTGVKQMNRRTDRGGNKQ